MAAERPHTAQRLAAALAAAKALPAGTFGPFSYRTAYRQSAAAGLRVLAVR